MQHLFRDNFKWSLVPILGIIADGVWDGMSFPSVKYTMVNKHSNLRDICSSVYSSARAGNRKVDDVTIILAKVIES